MLSENGASITMPVSRQVFIDGKRYQELQEPYEGRFEHLPPSVEDASKVFIDPSSMRSNIYRVRIQKGFLWRPSIPMVFWPLVPMHYIYPASLVHDWIYRYKGRLEKGGQFSVRFEKKWYDINRVSRKFADQAFREVMKATNVPAWRRKMAYAGVRIGGGFKWESKYDPIGNKLKYGSG